MSAHPEASNKARAISRGADLVAAYASDARGWDYPITGREVFDATAPDTDDGGDLDAIIRDAIADILHLATHLGMNADAIESMARRHYLDEHAGHPDTAWRAVSRSDVEYVPAIASTAYEPVMVVFRHPDYDTDTTEHYLDVRVVDIDLGSSFDITTRSADDDDTIAEYADALRDEVSDLPADHTARIEVEQIITEYLADEEDEA
jgi:hypothetical protein